MDTQEIVKALKAERNRLDQAIAGLGGEDEIHATMTPMSLAVAAYTYQGSATVCRQQGANGYADETTMGGPEEEGLVRQEIKCPRQRGVDLARALAGSVVKNVPGRC